MAAPTPAAEIDVTPELVRELVDTQFKQFHNMKLQLVGNGWDNAMYRLGPNMVARLPRRQLAAPLIENEQLWLPVLSPTLPLPTPKLLGAGQPQGDYPWQWSILSWLPGTPIGAEPLASGGEALAGFLNALHQSAPADAPANSHRGVPLDNRWTATTSYLDAAADDPRLASTLDVPRLTELWAQLCATKAYEGPPLWLHGDLHPLNMLRSDAGELSGVIDFGDVTSGDPATDIASCFSALDRQQQEVFRQALGCDEHTWLRAHGWALSLALAYIAFGADNQVMTTIGINAINAVLGSLGE